MTPPIIAIVWSVGWLFWGCCAASGAGREGVREFDADAVAVAEAEVVVVAFPVDVGVEEEL
jgi:hypothetical protein